MLDVQTTPLLELAVSRTASLICFANRNSDRIYRITWYKLGANARNDPYDRELIYQYSPSGLGATERIGRDYKTRLSKQGEVIDIDQINLADAGRYLCEIEDRNEGVKGQSETTIRVQDVDLSIQITRQNVTSNSIEIQWVRTHGRSYESMVRWRPKPDNAEQFDERDQEILKAFPEYVWKTQRLSPKYNKYKIIN